MLNHKESVKSKVFDVSNVILMLLIVFVTLYPFWYVLVGSFNDGIDFQKGGVWFWPRSFTFENYSAVFKNNQLITALGVTVLRTGVGVFTHIIFTAVFAFGYSYRKLRFRKFYAMICIIPMFIGGGLMPYYILINSLRLIDNFLVYIIPGLFSFWDVLIMRSFFRSISDSLLESAQIDGAGAYRILFSIYLPLSMPVIAALALFCGVGHWNSYFDSMLYINNNTGLYTLQHIIMRIVKSKSYASGLLPPSGSTAMVTTESLQFATMMAATLPILCVYPFIQRYFTLGVLTGSVKE